MKLLDSALRHYRNEEFSLAIKKLDKANAIAPRGDAYLLKGLCFLRSGNPDSARLAFHQTINLPGSPQLHEEARAFLRQIQENTWKRVYPYSLSVALAGGTNSNVFANGKNEEKVAEPVGESDVVAAFTFPQRHRIQYDYEINEIHNYPQARVQSHGLEAQLNAERKQRFLQITPRYLYQSLGDRPFTSQVGARLRFLENIGDHQFGVEYAYHQVSALNTIYDYLKGSNQIGLIQWSYWQKYADFSLLALYATENIGDLQLTNGTLPLGNRSYGPGASVAWYPNPQWSVTGSFFYIYRGYFRPAEPASVLRKDRQATMALKVSYRFDSALSFFGSFNYIINSSTLGSDSVQDKNYRQLIALGGLAWDAFQ